MAPAAVAIDTTSDFNPSSKPSLSVRTLLLAPPSVSAHPEALDHVYEAHDRNATDIQMLDRLALGLVSLPASTYDVVLLLADADGTRSDSAPTLGRDVMAQIVAALKAGGRLRSQNGTFGASSSGPAETEAILAGLVAAPRSDGGMMKPESDDAQSVPLRLARKGADAAATSNDAVPVNLNGKRKSMSEAAPPAGVGFVDFSDDLDDPFVTGDDDELIDEDELLTEEDKARTVIPPPECQPREGKRRKRACKDCSCGMKEKIEAEDAAKRSAADKTLGAMKLGADDLAEVDFTVQGKVGSCGNCALGDAFRCDGCPYIGLPAFKPGEEVRLLNDDVQL